MQKYTVVLVVALLITAPAAQASEMFEAYPKQYAVGYVSDELNLRYWVNPTWGLDANVSLSDQNTTDNTDDGIVQATDTQDSNSYSISVAAVRSVKSYEYFDLNLKAGVGYSHGKSHSDPEGPNNSARETTKSYSLYIGPEVEIKLPYFSRLVLVSSIQAVYLVEKDNVVQEDIAGTTTSSRESKTFGLQSEGDSLNSLFHIGLRYYF